MQEWRRQNGSAAVFALVPVSSGADGAVYMLSVWLAPLPADVPWCRLYIVATDSGNLTTTTHLDLFIDDSAASPPPLTFTQTSYAASVSTDALPGTCLTTVHATTAALNTDHTPRSTAITMVPASASASASACPSHYIVYTVAPPLLCYSYFIFYCFLFFYF